MDFKYEYFDGKEFLAVGKKEEFANGKGIKIQFPDDDDMQVAVIRYQDEIYCLGNICPHRHAAEIYNGILTDGNVTCPLHGWTYNLATGANTNLKQGIRSLKTYEVIEIDGIIYIEKPKLEIPKWRQID